MLRLTEQISRDIAGVGLFIRDNQNLARARDHIDGNGTEDLLLRFGDKGVAGADDLVHLGNALGAVRQSGDRLCAADLEDLIDARNGRRR